MGDDVHFATKARHRIQAGGTMKGLATVLVGASVLGTASVHPVPAQEVPVHVSQEAAPDDQVAAFAIEWSMARFDIPKSGGAVIDGSASRLHEDAPANENALGRLSTILNMPVRQDALLCPPGGSHCTLTDDVSYLIRVRVEPELGAASAFVANVVILEGPSPERRVGGRSVRMIVSMGSDQSIDLVGEPSWSWIRIAPRPVSEP